MAKTFRTHNGDHFFLLAAITGAIAAVFMVTVWAPVQVRAFTNAIATPSEATATSGAWARIPFVTADGDTTSIEASNGQVRVVTMMYTHCPGVCPMAVSTLQRMESRLSAAQRSGVSLIALSLDPEADSVNRLHEFRTASGIAPGGINAGQWVLGRPSPEGVRQLAAAMGVNYRLLADGTVDHQSVFVLLGRNGELLARSSNTRDVDPKFFGALQMALSSRR